jgi:hypothetical protein
MRYPQIRSALLGYSTGIFKAAEFSGKVWSQEYDAEVSNWKFWANKDYAHEMTAWRVLTLLLELAFVSFFTVVYNSQGSHQPVFCRKSC